MAKVKEKINKTKVKEFLVDMILLFIACSAGAFSTVSVMIPNGLTSGGLTGIVRLLHHAIPIDFSTLYYCASFLIVITVAIVLGIKESRKILLLTVMYPTVLKLFEMLDVEFLQEKDILLAAVFCGVFSGLCAGIVFWRGYCFSGTDAIAKIIRKKMLPHVSQSKIMLSIDAIVIVCSAYLFGRNIALYALITQVVISKTIDTVMFGLESKIVQMEIITKSKKDEIASYIMEEIGRGVSSEKVTGMYTLEVYAKLRVMCSPRESIVIKKHLQSIDENVFVTVIQADSVWGNGKGFKSIDEEER
ncbi:MAG: YitT family protein [Anaerovoracaceae bacterium]